jgi:chromosome segregation and condensation protein ScpB
VVSLLTTRIESKAFATYVSEQSGASANLQLTTGALEVLACIAFRQPISQAEIDQLFDADKRGLVVKLRDLKLVEEFAGAIAATLAASVMKQPALVAVAPIGAT